MKKIAIIAGGRSPEHEVSILSAYNISKAFDSSEFEVLIIGISKSGVWYLIPKEHLSINNLQIGGHTEHKLLALFPFSKKPIRLASDINSSVEVDVCFPITHGTLGEDGALQGLLEHLNLPYVGPGVLGSAIGMDKDVAKCLLNHAGIRVTPWVMLFKDDTIDTESIESKLKYPMFVKPANMGSGVGVLKANNQAELLEAIKEAFNFDIKLIIETGINGREVETAVLGNLKTKGTGVGEIIVDSGYYTYENKYINGDTKVVIPAEGLSEKTVSLIQQTAKKAYRVLQLEGMSRVDFFYISDEEFYLNEVNTLPGFTNISMYPKLWEAEGVSYSQLLKNLIETAEERYSMRSILKKDR